MSALGAGIFYEVRPRGAAGWFEAMEDALEVAVRQLVAERQIQAVLAPEVAWAARRALLLAAERV